MDYLSGGGASPVCDPDDFEDIGFVRARPIQTGTFIQGEDRYLMRLYDIFGVSGGDSVIPADQYYSALVQYPDSYILRWALSNDYGVSPYTLADIFQVEDNQGLDARINEFTWRDRPEVIEPGRISVRLDTDIDNGQYDAYFTLWLYNDRTQSAIRLERDFVSYCVPEDLGPTYSDFIIPETVAADLAIEVGDAVYMRAKVEWDDDGSPCGSAFLETFMGFTNNPGRVADSAPVIVRPPDGLTSFIRLGDGLLSEDGAVDFEFQEVHQGLPEAFAWRWRKGSQYWQNGAWRDLTPAQAYFHVIGNSSDPFFQHWQWDQAGGRVYASSPYPMAGMVDAFISEQGGSETVTIELRMTFAGEHQLDELVVAFQREEAPVPDPLLTGITMWIDQDGTPVQVDSLDRVVGEVPPISFQVHSNSPGTIDFHAGLYYSEDGSWQQQNCVGSNALNGFLQLDGTSFDDDGNRIYHLSSSTASTGSLLQLLEQQTGAYQVRLGLSWCVGYSFPININPRIGEGFTIRFHYRDHIGSSTLSRAYTTVPDPGVTGTPNIDLTLSSGQVSLYAQTPEVNRYSPFGERLDSVALTNDGRFTDHEFDVASGYNYMKGRYQMPVLAGFNRPDPKRDWDWTKPVSLNLYQYVRNDPINGYDPDGYGLVTKALKLGKLGWKAGKKLVTERKLLYRAEAAEAFSENIKDFQALTSATSFGDAIVPALSLASELLPVSKADVKDAGRLLGFFKKSDNGKAVGKKADGPARKTDACFAAGTGVLTRDGVVPIEQIRAGDLILSRSDQTGEWAWLPAYSPVVTNPAALVTLTYQTESGNHELITTLDHPFWSVTRDQWVEAGDLGLNDQLFLDEDQRARILGFKVQWADEGESFTTYNFGVRRFHTYFVLPVGENDPVHAVWVHNNDCPGEADGAANETTLFRAVMPDELQDIQQTGQFANRGSAEGKYFTTSSEAASSYAEQAVNAFKDPPYTTVKTTIPTQSLPKAVDVDGGIPAFVIPNKDLPDLKPEVLDHMAIPKK